MTNEDKLGPRETLEQFLDAWSKAEWAQMGTLTQRSWLELVTSNGLGITEALRTLFQNKLEEYEIIAESELNNVVYAAHCRFRIQIARGVYRNIDVAARVICEEAPMMPSPDGTWGVNPQSLFNELKPGEA